jgi:hypothetical protein
MRHDVLRIAERDLLRILKKRGPSTVPERARHVRWVGNADPDIPILKQGKAEYAKLQ